ncbi:MAG: aconitate hydratase [Bacteroidota bacterium]
MGDNLAMKIIRGHLIAGEPVAGREIGLRIDQTLTQDATGTMAYLQFEAMGLPAVRTELSVSYVDHNTLQTGFENADDHLFLATAAARYGIIFSRPGNGICHQVHLERFAAPGKTLLGSDSHTPTAGGLGSLAIGAGGLDVAVAMAGGPFYLTMPRVAQVWLTGRLAPWVSAKDVILSLLGRLTVRGGLGLILEYAGPGVSTLSVPERATITNMGAELGATTSLFPSDEVALAFLRAQGRAGDWRPLSADPDAAYDERLELDLSALEPLAACPHSHDAVLPVREIGPLPVAQVLIGSCTNSSYADLAQVAAILRGRRVHPATDLAIAPGSRQVLAMMARNGCLADLIAAGARILETACGPCIGMGQAPPSGAVSVRTFNRNFQGRSGTADARIYLAGPAVAAATALNGRLTDPRALGDPPALREPEEYYRDDHGFVFPSADRARAEIVRGPNIKPLPRQTPLPAEYAGEVLLKVGDNITTDHIMPAGAKILPLRSNIPAIAAYVFAGLDPDFAARAKAAGGGIIVAGENYGQGSSREHAALAPMYLGVRIVIAKSFARIHRANLVNFGLLPLTFADPADYDRLARGHRLRLPGLPEALERGEVAAADEESGRICRLKASFSPREVEILKAGGLLNRTVLDA